MLRALGRLLGLAALASLSLAACGSPNQRAPLTIAYPPTPVAGRCPQLATSPIPRTLAPGALLRLTATDPATGDLICDSIAPVSKGGLGLAFPRQPSDGGASSPLNLAVELFTGGASGDGGVAPALLAYGHVTGYDPSFLRPLTIALVPEGIFGCAQSPLHVARAFHTVTPLPNGQLLISGGLVANASGNPKFDSALSPSLYATSRVEIYDPTTQSTIPITESVPGGGTATARAFGAAYAVPFAATQTYQVLLVGGLTPQDPTMPVMTAYNPMGTAQPLRLWPTANAAPAQAELLQYDPIARTVQHQKLTLSTEQHLLEDASRIEPTIAGPLDATPLQIGVASTDPTTSSWTTPTFGGVVLSTTAEPTSYGPDSMRLPHVGSSILPLPGPTALVWGGNLLYMMSSSSVPYAAELLTGISPPATIDSCTLTPTATGITGAGLTAYQTLTPLGAPATQPYQALVTGGFAIQPTSGASPPASALAPFAPFGELLQVSAAPGGTLTCNPPVPLVSVQAVAPITGLSPIPVGYHDAIRLPDGRVLITGGSPDPSSAVCPAPSYLCSVAQAILYDPKSNMLLPLPGPPIGTPGVPSDGGLSLAWPPGMVVDRFGHRMMLAGYTVFVTGGVQLRSASDLEVVDSVESYGDRPVGPETFTYVSPDGGTATGTRVAGDVARDAMGNPLAPCAAAE